MSAFDNLFIEQRSTIEQLKRILPNYRKLGKEKFSAVKTRNRITALQDMWTSCKSLHVKLQQTATETQRQHQYFTEEEFFDAEGEFEDSLDTLAELLSKQEKPAQSVATSKAGDTTLFGEAHNTSAFALPRITIPAFKGDPTRWESFRDSYNALVGSNDTLNNAQKLYFFKSFLEGEAARIIEHIQISDANYDGAWGLLVDEYDNSRALVHAHIHAFASLPIMKTETSRELKHLRDTASASLSALVNLKRPVEHWDDLLVYIISQKLSSRTRTEWNLRLGASNDYPSFKVLKEFLTERIRGIAEPVNFEEASSGVSQSGVKGKTKAAVHNATARKCPCCKGNYFLTFCPAFRKKSVEQRYQIAKQARVCFNCLRPGHFPAQCPSENRCSTCQKSHHSVLHRDNSEKKEPASEPPRQAIRL
ncbi:unnamed protein product [Lasius platythorax]|uniref:CCHC-type domain-containing protein n=1 Tax=Lasius platythorax TaxID=488582 RepID=A0AAV2MVU1_9HYME